MDSSSLPQIQWASSQGNQVEDRQIKNETKDVKFLLEQKLASGDQFLQKYMLKYTRPLD